MAKTSVKDLKNIKSFDKLTLSKWGIIGAIVLFAFAIVATIIISVFDANRDHNAAIYWIFSLVGLGLGIAYLVLGVFGVVSTVKSHEGKWWGFFLAGAILAILAPLGFFGIGGIVIAALAAAMFLTYILLEKK